MAEKRKRRARVIDLCKCLADVYVGGSVLIFLSFIVLIISSIVFALPGLCQCADEHPFLADSVFLFIGLAASIIYCVGFWTKSGWTIGKGALGIKIVGHDGQPKAGAYPCHRLR